VTPAHKAIYSRYNMSEKGRARHRRYNHSAKGHIRNGRRRSTDSYLEGHRTWMMRHRNPLRSFKQIVGLEAFRAITA